MRECTCQPNSKSWGINGVHVVLEYTLFTRYRLRVAWGRYHMICTYTPQQRCDEFIACATECIHNHSSIKPCRRTHTYINNPLSLELALACRGYKSHAQRVAKILWLDKSEHIAVCQLPRYNYAQYILHIFSIYSKVENTSLCFCICYVASFVLAFIEIYFVLEMSYV